MIIKTGLIVVIVIFQLCAITTGNPDAKRLYDDLLSTYNRLIRPVSNNTETVLVKLGLRLSQLIDLNLKDQILTTNVWLEHEWQDYKLKWDPLEYGGVTELYVPSEHIWLPDIVLYNNADGEYVVTTLTKAILHYTGKVVWTPPAIFKSSCEIDVRYFPFDQQTCFMKFGSWTYDGYQIDLKHINQKKQNPGVDDNKVEIGIDLHEFYPSVEWDILGVPAERHEKYYPCCVEPYPDIFFNITLRRKTLFYTVNLIIPCVGISYLSVLVFYLPADSGEKIALCISILLSQTMFFLLISEIIPSTSLALPLLGKYLLFTMVLVGLSVVVTIIIINIHYRKPSTHKMAPWVRSFFIKTLPTLLLMRVPKDLLRDLAAKKINYGNKIKKSKFTAALAAEMQINSGGSSPDSIRQMQGRGGGCNGLHTTSVTNRFSGLMGAFGGGLGQLGNMTGYNGLPSVMSGLNESLSDIAPRKKYPFELEKAIHNVMFIQHHITRQDEFNAIDLKHINQLKGILTENDNKVEIGMDLHDFYPSVEWDILAVPAERHEKYYPCCVEPYPDIFFNITLRRKTLFYTVNLIIPCVGISYLSVLVFYLPADSGEKIALCISILLSQTMFFLLISEIIPSTSLALPLLGKYLLFTMVLVGLSVVVTIVILNIHYRKPSTHKMAPWVRSFFIKFLPTILLMRVPKDLLRDLAARKVDYGSKIKKSKFAAALAAEMQINSGGSSPDSVRRMQGIGGGCNGIHTTSVTNRFSGLMGAFGGGLGQLGNMAGYNGLPSVMSGLNESLSDIEPTKKYPFELEKAIHNVMFIQHHISRQDEFNAEDQDWGFVALVLDRLFLWLFMIASIIGTFAILCEAPSLYDDTKPIDIYLSFIAQQIYNLTMKH